VLALEASSRGHSLPWVIVVLTGLAAAACPRPEDKKSVQRDFPAPAPPSSHHLRSLPPGPRAVLQCRRDRRAYCELRGNSDACVGEHLECFARCGTPVLSESVWWYVEVFGDGESVIMESDSFLV
jgi:hypothetical protein